MPDCRYFIEGTDPEAIAAEVMDYLTEQQPATRVRVLQHVASRFPGIGGKTTVKLVKAYITANNITE